MKTFLICILASITLLISACIKDKIPSVYRIDIQQGNDITQQMINKLRPDMTQSQVTYVMGTPLLIDTFHPERWNYIYTFHPGNGSREQRRITLFFEKDLLHHIEGDIRIIAREDLPQINKKGVHIIVPLSKKKTGLFQGLLNKIGLGEDEADVIVKDANKETDASVAEEKATE